MKLGNTLLLVLVTIALVIGVAIFENKHPGTRELAHRKFQVVDFDPASVEKIVLINNEERIELVRSGGVWLLESPIKDKADGALAQQILDSLLDLRPSAVLNETKQEVEPKAFGVNKSNISLELFGQGMPARMLFGKNAAVEGQLYVRLADSNRIYVIPSDLRDLVTRKTEDFRDRTLMDLQPDQTKRMVIRSEGGEIELQKENERWQILKPIRARANDGLINKLITQITKLQAKGFAADKDAAALGEPFGTVTLSSEVSEKPTSLSLIEAPATVSNGVYAKLSTRNSVFILDRVVSGLFKARPNDLRDRHLMRVNLDTVDRITIQPAGKPKTVLARSQDGWSMNGKPDADGKLKAFIGKLLAQQVVTFVADTGSDLEKYGLKQPVMKITFSSYASENTPETDAGEKPITSLLLGRVENGELYAKLEEEPFVVSIDSTLLDLIPQ